MHTTTQTKGDLNAEITRLHTRASECLKLRTELQRRIRGDTAEVNALEGEIALIDPQIERAKQALAGRN